MQAKQLVWGMAAVVCAAGITLGLAACSAKKQDASGTGAGASGADAGPGGLGTAASSGAGSSGGKGGLLVADEACGIGNAWAQLSPLNMFVMFDRSGSMEKDNKWSNATAALTSFFENPAAAELRVALRFFPHQEPTPGCTKDACDAVACSQPLVDLGPLTAASAPTDVQEGALVTAIKGSAPGGEGDGTPIFAALDGALRWASAFKSAHIDEKTVVVFVTDGKPNGCDEDFDHISALAADALASPGVTTYAIGLAGSSEAQMDQLAGAGGSMQGIFIDQSATAERELLSALDRIRGANLSCDFSFPEPISADRPIDPDVISVSFINGPGTAPVMLDRVTQQSGCGASNAWYYDVPQKPTRIFLCPTACDAVRAEQNAGLQILLGCATGTGRPLYCRDHPDDPSCSVQ